MTFLFIHNDHLSPNQRAKETSSLIRGHARRHRLQRQSRRDENHSSRTKRELKTLLPRNEEPTFNSQDELPESENLFANPNGVIDILSDQALHFRMLQLDFEPRRLIQFYLSWNDTQSYSGSALSWTKWIVHAAFNNELNLLALPCYIASMVSYLRQTATSTQRKRVKDSGKASMFNYRSTSFDSYFDQNSPQASQSANVSEYSTAFKSTDISLLTSSFSCDLCENWLNDPCPHVAESYSDHNTPDVGELSDAWQFISDTSLPETSDLAQLTQLALGALQSRVSTRNKASFSTSFSSELVFPVWCLFRAAIFQNDEFAAVSHERFLRHLIFRSDGSQYFSSRLVNVIVKVDLTLSVTRVDQKHGGHDKRASALLVKSELHERSAMVS